MVFRWHPQQFGDDRSGQRPRVVGDQLDPAPAPPFAFHGVEESFAERLDPPPQPLSTRRGVNSLLKIARSRA
jgi:hypothetical protein